MLDTLGADQRRCAGDDALASSGALGRELVARHAPSIHEVDLTVQ